MFDRATQRPEVLSRLSAALREEERLAGVVLVGGANGFRDDDSDIDLVVPVTPAYDAATVFRAWQTLINDVIPVRYHAATAFTKANHLLAALCDRRLEVVCHFRRWGRWWS